MRLLVAASRSFNHLNRRHISFRGAHLNHWSVCCWIPLFGLLATHPFAVWSFPLDNQRTRAFTFFPNPAVIMPPSRSSSTKIEATKQTEDEASPRRSPRKRTRKGEEDQEEPKPTAKKATATKTKGATTKKRTIAASDDESVTKKKRTKGTTTKKRASAKASDDESVASTGSKGKAKKKKSPAKKKASDHQRITERDEIKKLWDAEKALADGSYTFKIASWNVAGLRAVIKKMPNALAELCKEHDLDMLCLQETKLQESHLDDPKLKIRGLLKEAGYDDYWSCSTAKKGYSGTAVFLKQRGKKQARQKTMGDFFGSKAKGDSDAKKEPPELPINTETVTPVEVTFSIANEIDNEGRVNVCDFPFATIANVYVPNSGQTLQRLEYRTSEWDTFFLEFMQKKETDRGLPVIWLGDLNIAHKALDVWNDGAKHLDKQAGVTLQERASFQEQLDAGYIDAFRKLHPEAKGHYSYWSQRAGNREPNKGLRLDYFICSPALFSEESKVIVRDSYMLKDQVGSDHCPVVLELEIKN